MAARRCLISNLPIIFLFSWLFPIQNHFTASDEITIEEIENPLSLYYEINYRTYSRDATFETFDLKNADSWKEVQTRVAHALSMPQSQKIRADIQTIIRHVTIPPGETVALTSVNGEKAVYNWSARVLNTQESLIWDDPQRAHNACRFLLLELLEFLQDK